MNASVMFQCIASSFKIQTLSPSYFRFLSKSCSLQFLIQIDTTIAVFLEGMKTPPSGPFRG